MNCYIRYLELVTLSCVCSSFFNFIEDILRVIPLLQYVVVETLEAFKCAFFTPLLT